MKHKLLSLLIATLLVAGAAACQPADSTQPTSLSAQSGESAGSTGSSSTDESSPQEEASGDLEPLELVVAMAISGRDEDGAAVDEAMSAITQEQINATVSTIYIPMASWTQQTNVMLISGEQIDVIMSGSIHGFTTNAGKGQFLPLNDLLEQHGQGVMGSLNDTLLQCGTINGQVYGVPSLRDLATAPCILMRSDLVEKHGIDLDAINTFDDLTPCLKPSGWKNRT